KVQRQCSEQRTASWQDCTTCGEKCTWTRGTTAGRWMIFNRCLRLCYRIASPTGPLSGKKVPTSLHSYLHTSIPVMHFSNGMTRIRTMNGLNVLSTTIVQPTDK